MDSLNNEKKDINNTKKIVINVAKVVVISAILALIAINTNYFLKLVRFSDNINKISNEIKQESEKKDKGVLVKIESISDKYRKCNITSEISKVKTGSVFVVTRYTNMYKDSYAKSKKIEKSKFSSMMLDLLIEENKNLDKEVNELLNDKDTLENKTKLTPEVLKKSKDISTRLSKLELTDELATLRTKFVEVINSRELGLNDYNLGVQKEVSCRLVQQKALSKSKIDTNETLTLVESSIVLKKDYEAHFASANKYFTEYLGKLGL